MHLLLYVSLLGTLGFFGFLNWFSHYSDLRKDKIVLPNSGIIASALRSLNAAPSITILVSQHKNSCTLQLIILLTLTLRSQDQL